MPIARQRARKPLLLLLCLLALMPAAAASAHDAGQGRLKVTATAYNSLPDQTRGRPDVGAWGDRLKPGMKAIAVSRDLIKLGLTPGTRVRIEGLPGVYRVLDKMHSRWHRKIDIYMGTDLDAALEWGRRAVTIRWTPEES